ncbi:hypothetical protein MTR67_021670 [Solanum verrucosum]|uniref:Uncharacterized protein n=1 Tax=Solanum verrucosum TaxID=315347 RepID=A0AAF0TW00_SOLVR|nr:hypothetical protein MTR67_021670 [Solanum verrucosum]
MGSDRKRKEEKINHKRSSPSSPQGKIFTFLYLCQIDNFSNLYSYIYICVCLCLYSR